MHGDRGRIAHDREGQRSRTLREHFAIASRGAHAVMEHINDTGKRDRVWAASTVFQERWKLASRFSSRFHAHPDPLSTLAALPAGGAQPLGPFLAVCSRRFKRRPTTTAKPCPANASSLLSLLFVRDRSLASSVRQQRESMRFLAASFNGCSCLRWWSCRRRGWREWEIAVGCQRELTSCRFCWG